MRTLYNRNSFKSRFQKNLKRHILSKNLDRMIYLNYIFFIKRLAEVSSNSAIQHSDNRSKKSKIAITDQIIKNNTEQVVREFRG